MLIHIIWNPAFLPLILHLEQQQLLLGCMIFNDSASGDPAVAVFDFGGDKTSTAGSFTIQFPTADASNAVIRIA